MRRVRLAILGASPCHLCTAACCKQNAHEYAALLRGDGEVRRFAAFAVDVPIRTDDGRLIIEKVLPYLNGRCQFLGADDRCTIYADRPQACRAFQCVEDFNRGGVGLHDPFLRRNADVLRMLQAM